MSFETIQNTQVPETESEFKFDYTKEFEDMWEEERQKLEEQQNNDFLGKSFDNLLICMVAKDKKDPTRSA